jgi:hypothetical protein
MYMIFTDRAAGLCVAAIVCPMMTSCSTQLVEHDITKRPLPEQLCAIKEVDSGTEWTFQYEIDDKACQPIESQMLHNVAVRWNPVSQVSSDHVLVSGWLMGCTDLGPSGAFVAGVRVLLASNQDSSIRPLRYDSAHELAVGDGLLDSKGFFQVLLPVSLLKRPVNLSELRAVGLCLADLSRNKTVVQTLDSPVLEKSKSRLSIIGPQALRGNLRLLNSLPLRSAVNYDPIAVCETVNKLRTLPKPELISLMQDYCSIATNNNMVLRDPCNIDTSDRNWIVLLAMLLFEPSDGVPWPSVQGHFGDSSVFALSTRTFPIYLRDGIPFLLDLGTVSGFYVVVEPGEMLDWVRDHGAIRQSICGCARNPFEVAAEIELDQEWYKLFATMREAGARERFLESIRSQVANVALREPSVSALVGEYHQHGTESGIQTYEWNRLQSASMNGELVWDPTECRFTHRQ